MSNLPFYKPQDTSDFESQFGLPHAPLAMPKQILEHAPSRSAFSRLAGLVRLQSRARS